MSGIRDTATVTLTVNGAQAKQMMADLEAKIKQTEQTIDNLKKSMADPKDIEKAKRELRTYQKQLDEMRSATEGVNRAIENIKLATPRQLEKSLRTLNRQLKDMTPGSEVWDSHVEKIRELKERLAEIKEEVSEQKSLWEQFSAWSVSAWPALELIKGWNDDLISFLRQYVDAFAEMDQEMANVRKFTGMTEAQVRSLNEEFKKIDTRTSREELNKLAQEAGRLGKTSIEDVLGFVRAADKINVALDDLGEGATLTLSKLTGIFGDEQRFGTEQSLLKVGSVINELSQNCSAAAPYLANFAERMGGVGSQAGLTIQQIMGFAAVLDSNSQKVEASSTALSQVIVRLYQEPAKYARVAGLDVENFTKLLKTDTNAALILFLETLQKAGGMDSLSPMFKDMGENGSRAIAALSTLATHIEQVKAQQEAANIAFEEGTSIDKEFAVQNDTVQGSLEKCKNAANELRVQLGEYLYPLMGHFMTTGAALMRIILTLVNWIVEYKNVLVSLAAAFAIYKVAVSAATIETKIHTAYVYLNHKAIQIWRGGVLLMAAAQALLTGNLMKARKAMHLFNLAMKINPYVLLISSITALAVTLMLLTKRTSEATMAKKQLAEAEREATGAAKKELSETQFLYDKTQDVTIAMEKRIEAAKQLQKLHPETFSNLSAEAIVAGDAADAYRRLANNILAASRAKAYEGKVDENTSNIVSKESKRDSIIQGMINEGGYGPEISEILHDPTKDNKDIVAALYKHLENQEKSHVGVNSYNPGGGQNNKLIRGKVLTQSLKSLQDDIDALEQRNEDLQNRIFDLRKNQSPTVLDTNNDDNNDDDDDDYDPPTPTPDRFAKEKQWRERAEAEARIYYFSPGEKSYTDYMQRMNQIAVDYNQMLLDREDVVGNERLKIQADYWEALHKRDEDAGKMAAQLDADTRKQRVDEENKSYNETLYNLNESLRMRLSAENLSAKERENAEKIHQEAAELAELNHLARLVNIYEEGSDERLQAQKAYQDAQLKAQKRHQQEYEKREAEYADIKAKVFGDNPEEKQQKYDTAFEALKVVYAREIAAAGDNAAEKLRIEEAFLQAQNELRRQYGLESEEDTRNSMQRAVESSVEWLNSDGGKAVTGTISTLTSGMSSIFSGLSTMMQAELELQTASINKKYDAEIQAAQGNSYKVAKLEKKKEAEIAKAKNEANRKMFAMQVIQAVAQTAQNALAAYGSAAQVPVVGYILAPIAAAMAVAAGAIQIAAIKKQQQASAAQGYSKGGFTRPGRVDEPAGIVHAGEWVASQKLLANPVARPLIEHLDHVQRTNTIGSLRSEDVSRAITAPQTLNRIMEGDASSALMVAAIAQSSSVVERLAERLEKPIAAITTVAGDYGINQAKDEYDALLRNVTPKSKQK